MVSYLVYNLFVAHIVADFYFQTDKSCSKKAEKGLKGWEPYKHFLCVLVLTWLVVFDWHAWWLAAIVAGSHFVIDAVKPYVQKRCVTNNELWVFIVDQILHLAVLGGAGYLWFQYNSWQEFGWLMECSPKYVLLSTALMLSHKPSNILLNLIIKYCEVPVPNESSKRDGELHGAFHSGALIGTLERVLMIVLIVMSQYEAIGFLIAAKSILRFSSVNESEKSEYVVAGTFISFCIALFLGLLVVKLG